MKVYVVVSTNIERLSIHNVLSFSELADEYIRLYKDKYPDCTDEFTIMEYTLDGKLGDKEF